MRALWNCMCALWGLCVCTVGSSVVVCALWECVCVCMYVHCGDHVCLRCWDCVRVLWGVRMCTLQLSAHVRCAFCALA